MDMALRVLGVVAALPMLANGFGWIHNPAEVAASLGMPLLEGLGRSTQIGDFTSLFLSTAVLAIFGAARRNAPAFFAAALLMALAASGRLLATTLHDAPFAAFFISVEATLALIWAGCGTYFQRVSSAFPAR